MIKKFLNSLNGFKYVIKDPSIMIQFLLAVLTLIISCILKFNILKMIIVLILIVIVICLEITNSCIEELCNLNDLHYNDKIKKIKDMASFLVLFACIFSAIIFVILIFWR